MPDTPIPSVVAMLVCDQVIAEQGTGKKSLIGVFENIHAPGFPVLQGRMAVYARLVDAEGKYRFLIRLVKLDGEKIVAELQFETEIADRLSAAELPINIANIVLPEAGKYEFQLYANDVFLHRVTMNVIHGGFPWQQQPSR